MTAKLIIRMIDHQKTTPIYKDIAIANKLGTTRLYLIALMALIFPFVLPESENNVILQWVPSIVLEIPVIEKLSMISEHKYMMRCYLAIMLVLAPTLSLDQLMRGESLHSRFLYSLRINRNLRKLAVRSWFGVFILGGSNLFLYVFPPSLPDDFAAVNRSLKVLSFMLNNKPGLASGGALIFAGIYSIFWVTGISVYLAIVSTFNFSRK